MNAELMKMCRLDSFKAPPPPTASFRGYWNFILLCLFKGLRLLGFADITEGVQPYRVFLIEGYLYICFHRYQKNNLINVRFGNGKKKKKLKWSNNLCFDCLFFEQQFNRFVRFLTDFVFITTELILYF